MSLIEIEYGSLASSKDLNDNFNFLASQISTLSDNISTKVAGFSSNVATLNSSINKIMDLKESFIQVGTIVFSIKKVIPDGFLLCDGSELLVSDFEDLYKQSSSGNYPVNYNIDAKHWRDYFNAPSIGRGWDSTVW